MPNTVRVTLIFDVPLDEIGGDATADATTLKRLAVERVLYTHVTNIGRAHLLKKHAQTIFVSNLLKDVET